MRNLSCFLLLFCGDLHPAEEYELWWEKNINNTLSISTFDEWLGDIHSTSRVLMRRHVQKMGYRSIVDVPAGLCTDYFGFKHDGIAIEYLGVDITPKLVARGLNQGIPIIEGDIKSLPFPDNRYEVCYARHILEHLNGYEEAISDLIRVASREVFITFFIHPQEKEVINSSYSFGQLLYGNTYSKSNIEKFILSNPKTSDFEWEYVDGREIILHIYLNSANLVEWRIYRDKTVIRADRSL